MKRLLFRIIGVAAFFSLAFAQPRHPWDHPLEGRWDITVTTPTGVYPDWMEISQTDYGWQALIQPRSGGARRATGISVTNLHLILTLFPAAGKNPATTWDITLANEKLSGTEKRGGTVQAQLAGVRAPYLDRPVPKAWSDPQPLFNGTDLTGWEPANQGDNHWTAKGGVLINLEKGINLKTSRKFDDFQLHIEFNCPEGGNSGIFLRGRYEVQVEYEPADAGDKLHGMGSIYSFLGPAVDLPRKPGEWESFDITLAGRHVTVIRNGTKTIDNMEIPGITGGALDCDEGKPGPIMLQGDHTGGMKYRNIRISVPK